MKLFIVQIFLDAFRFVLQKITLTMSNQTLSKQRGQAYILHVRTIPPISSVWFGKARPTGY